MQHVTVHSQEQHKEEKSVSDSSALIKVGKLEHAQSATTTIDDARRTVALTSIDDARLAIIKLTMQMLAAKGHVSMKEQDVQQRMRDICVRLVNNAVSNWISQRQYCSWMMTAKQTSLLSAEDDAAKNAMKLVRVVSDFSLVDNEKGMTARCKHILDMSVTECCEYMKLSG